ncbi:hypothetical protein AAU01_18280 [Paenarthrobacter aurescens]|uniref:Uncharacterized protein n=1 Tax=Paenarthrobacter aurescens TaxID=43663 RepID=A0A4Y3NCW1_PAEAU|nr:hypothetical protein AAU01_18280 [Paenarthrobacter aurescens]
MAAASTGDKGNFARHRRAFPDDVLGVGMDVHDLGMGHAKTFNGLVHHCAWIINELFHVMLLGMLWLVL